MIVLSCCLVFVEIVIVDNLIQINPINSMMIVRDECMYGERWLGKSVEIL